MTVRSNRDPEDAKQSAMRLAPVCHGMCAHERGTCVSFRTWEEADEALRRLLAYGRDRETIRLMAEALEHWQQRAEEYPEAAQQLDFNPSAILARLQEPQA